MIRSPENCACPLNEIGPSVTNACSGQFLLFMSILEAFINGRCDLVDPCNRVSNREKLDDSYDFVVVGGGTAGSVVAGRLSENPQWKVLLIEAGGDEPVAASVPAWVTAYWGREETDWNYHTEPQEKACLSNNGVCSWHRGKMLGGCSAINGMMYMRGQPSDYDGWAINGAAGWSWSEILPYFLMSEDNKEIGNGVSAQYHTTGGPLPVQKFKHAPQFAHDVVSGAIELGFTPTTDLNGETNTGFTIAQTLNNGGSRYTTARAYLRPAAHRKNLHVLLNAHVSRVIIDPLHKKVTGVEYIKDGETRTVGVKKEAILSAGTLNSPHILMLSGVGPKATLDRFNIPTIKDLPGVGQNLHNHVGVEIDFTLHKEPDVEVLNWATAMEYMLNREGPLSSTGMSQLTGKVNSRLAAAGGRSPDIQYFFNGYYASCSDGTVTDKEKYQDITSRRDISVSVIALHPRSRGYLTLRSVDPMDPPIMQPNYFQDEHELDVLVDGAKILYKLANTTIMREKYGMAPKDINGEVCEGGGAEPTDEYFKCLAKHFTAPENHQVGTCKIGPATDPMAVVDMHLKVHGIKGLRVIDASVMPTVPSGNTAAPTIMIAERGAVFIMSNVRTENRFKGSDDGDGNQEGYNEGNNSWNYGTSTYKYPKDDKLTQSQGDNQRQNHYWKPWNTNWQNWENKPFQHNAAWHQNYVQNRRQT